LFHQLNIKASLHRDLIGNPTSHAWVISLYLVGESFPQTMDDFFQYRYSPDDTLKANLIRHEKDEVYHSRLLVKILDSLDQPKTNFDGHNVYNNVVVSNTTVEMRVTGEDTEDQKRLKFANFMAHLYFLETRVGSSIRLHADQCEKVGKVKTAKLLNHIVSDEVRHAAYTRQAVIDLSTHREHKAIMAKHRIAEQKSHLEFSANHMKQCRQKFSTTIHPKNKLAIRFAQLVMESARWIQ